MFNKIVKPYTGYWYVDASNGTIFDDDGYRERSRYYDYSSYSAMTDMYRWMKFTCCHRADVVSKAIKQEQIEERKQQIERDTAALQQQIKALENLKSSCA